METTESIPVPATISPQQTQMLEIPPTDNTSRQLQITADVQGLDVMSMGEVFAKSRLFKDVATAAQAIVKIQAGKELGLEPFMAMNGLYIIEGKIVMSANLMAALVVRSGRYRYRVGRIDNQACEIEFYMKDNGEWQPIGLSLFNVEDAQRAGLSGKDNWRKYARNMFFSRALSNGVRWFCPDVFAGPMYTPDEFDLPVNEDGELDDKRIDWQRVKATAVPVERTAWHRQAAQALYPKLEPFLVDQIKALALDPSVDNATFSARLTQFAGDAGVELPEEA